MRKALVSRQLPQPQFRYSTIIKTGAYFQTAGMIALDAESNQLETGGVKAETAKILTNLTQALPDFGLSLKDMVIARIYTTNFDKFSEINKAWEDVFEEGDVPPARTAVGVSQLPLGASVEMEFTFYKDVEAY